MKKEIFGIFAALLIISCIVAVSAIVTEESGDEMGTETLVDSQRPVPALYLARQENREEFREEALSGRNEIRNETRERMDSLREETRSKFAGLRNETIEKIIAAGGINNLTKEQREQYLEESKDAMERLREERKTRFEDIREEQKVKVEEFRERMKERKVEIRIENRQMTINSLTAEQKEIVVGKINARTGLNLSSEELGNGSVGEELRAWLSNGNYAKVKVMPDKASEVALKKLRAKCEDRNCSVELKEVGTGNKTRAAYEVKTEKDSRMLFLFKKKMNVDAQVDAETGELISSKKPWWAFLANEDNASESEIEIELESNESTLN